MIKCITLIQPWASWIAMGWKTIETRTHDRFASLEETRIAIHAGMKWDDDAAREAKPYLTDEQLLRTMDFYEVRGAIVATAFVAEAREMLPTDSQAALFRCIKGMRFGLVLDDVERLATPIPVRGAQGIWTYNGSI